MFGFTTCRGMAWLIVGETFSGIVVALEELFDQFLNEVFYLDNFGKVSFKNS